LATRSSGATVSNNIGHHRGLLGSPKSELRILVTCGDLGVPTANWNPQVLPRRASGYNCFFREFGALTTMGRRTFHKPGFLNSMRNPCQSRALISSQTMSSNFAMTTPVVRRGPTDGGYASRRVRLPTAEFFFGRLFRAGSRQSTTKRVAPGLTNHCKVEFLWIN
jgi:hypothetical protein